MAFVRKTPEEVAAFKDKILANPSDYFPIFFRTMDSKAPSKETVVKITEEISSGTF